ncbi:hypothetical protein MTR_7g118040 [Medicago truncatula]|uniref:Uncharacterized protein n=1 Tax=Medicago truncatula TaxID=3880 RepID=G7L530_MEDTR|nr:hypothetical protein MTR_7g118040 [Medicago truncatula]
MAAIATTYYRSPASYSYEEQHFQAEGGINPSMYLSINILPGHQALNLIEQRLQGIKPPT